ncbi:MAG: 16S rRNA methyltransferase [Piscirickettsiaceae bacterium CG_4_9_14_3_um_filter_43_564]|nr:class I SAM-dependent methyltransferase [Thiomicrospira sp.]OIP96038.1 MAG: 16S rRNA methyltransferase [Thiomicrospira sp. CG2_30_44_34]PIQ06025.1 MAG: 16S rRNA methyltransferase [Piscirickettsiaceae bacterium CG18_big_fil_WC_8_21_14_2_50_44_103]PIU38172.1 MAG: 16S rRNA methyltransferase [Piscirickettsiaceae bacterium CG07_land_8_20_14_0_80_44_28]PIW58790.1 MAG: 16S rRNA methyltransferase [Piscirickettsiaceae bacterium CG12_big_fil_rev_8_21_14_0_65_44_934]PIW78649.1 MAG: 16S rRNA methyltran
MLIAITETALPERAHALATKLGLPLTKELDAPPLMQLGWWQDPKQPCTTDGSADYKLALFSNMSGPVFIDFIQGKKNHRRQFGGGKGQPLARAVLAQQQPHIIDATAGMGGDGFVFAGLGCQVTLIERSPIIAALLADAIERTQHPDTPKDIRAIMERMTLIEADAADYLSQGAVHCDVVYCDPMYPEKKKTAAAPKEMQALQQLVGSDQDSQTLLAAALQVAQKRVVVKRPKKAQPLIGPTPNAQISSPNTRYDLYTTLLASVSN